MSIVTNYRAGFVLDPEITTLSLLKQAVAAGIPVRVNPVNDVSLGDEVCIVKLFKDRLVTPRGAKCSILRRKTVAIFRAQINAAGFITEVLK